MDVGSTTCKYVLTTPSGEILSQAYERHNTKQAEKVLDFLTRLETQFGFQPEQDRVFFTGSGAGIIAPFVGGKLVQEVVAVAASVEKFHPNVRFVSEIGGEDMKTIFFTGEGDAKSKQVLMQSACSGGTGTFIEKTARKLEITSEQLARMRLLGLHAAQGQQQVRNFRGSGFQQPAEGGYSGRGNHRFAVRGRRLSEPGHAHARQHSAAGNSAAGRAESFLHGIAGSVAASPGQDLEGT